MMRIRREVYLDNNATTPVAGRVQRRMARVLGRTFGNPSSIHRQGRLAAAELEESRLQVSSAIGCLASELCFTGSATEANNAVLQGLAETMVPGRTRIVSTNIEHPSIGSTLERLAGRGVDVRYARVDRGGRVDMGHLRELVDERTFLVCCGLANNEIGTVQDVTAVSELAHGRGSYVLSDCVQALGKIPVDVRALGVDYASFSGHKIHGPKGVGALFTREGSPQVSLILGGSQEWGLRAGTESVHNIAGFAEACAGTREMLADTQRVRDLRDLLLTGLRRLRPDMVLNTPLDFSLGNTASVTFPGSDNSILMAALDYHGIAVSAGSACHTQSNEPSHVLKAIGLSDEEARQTLRISLDASTTKADIRYAHGVFEDYFARRLPAVAMLSPAQLDEDLLSRPDIFILDVRFPHDRKLLKSLPNAHEFPFFTFRRYASRVPADRNVIVVCQVGVSAPIVAYHLRAKGYRHVSFLATGMAGWRVRHPALYEKLAGAKGSSART